MMIALSKARFVPALNDRETSTEET